MSTDNLVWIYGSCTVLVLSAVFGILLLRFSGEEFSQEHVSQWMAWTFGIAAMWPLCLMTVALLLYLAAVWWALDRLANFILFLARISNERRYKKTH